VTNEKHYQHPESINAVEMNIDRVLSDICHESWKKEVVVKLLKPTCVKEAMNYMWEGQELNNKAHDTLTTITPSGIEIERR
jgi:hypothetical protein